MMQPTQNEIHAIIDYWRTKIAKNAGRRPNISADWAARIEEWRAELRTAPNVDRPYRKLLEAILLEQAK